MNLSVVISAYNEEEKIEDCLKSVNFADEVIFVDNTSEDKTVEIAKKYTSKIFTRQNDIMLNRNKNFGFTKAKGDWILSLDADERITPQLQREIRLTINNQQPALPAGRSTINGYWIPRKNILFGKWIKSDMWWPDYQLRLIRRGKGKFAEKHVHEYLKVEGKTEKLKNPMEHLNYSSISQFLYKMDKIYSESEVQNFQSSGKNITWVDAIRFPINDFLKTFFAQKGYRDGLHGLVLSMLQALYAEVVFAKVWERQGFKEENSETFLRDVAKEFKKISKEFQYWFFSSFINESRNSIQKLFYKIFRKL